jgi:hypothetical protein
VLLSYYLGWDEVCLLIDSAFLFGVGLLGGWMMDISWMEQCKWPTTYTSIFVYLILTCYFVFVFVLLKLGCFPCLALSFPLAATFPLFISYDTIAK